MSIVDQLQFFTHATVIGAPAEQNELPGPVPARIKVSQIAGAVAGDDGLEPNVWVSDSEHVRPHADARSHRDGQGYGRLRHRASAQEQTQTFPTSTLFLPINSNWCLNRRAWS